MVKIKDVIDPSRDILRWSKRISAVIKFDNDSHTKLLKFVESQIDNRKILSFTFGVCNAKVNEMKIETVYSNDFRQEDFLTLYNNQDNPNYQLMYTNHKDPIISFLAELLVKFN